MAKIDEGTPSVGDGERLVTLSLTMPSSVPTRALTTLEEDAVHTVDVLLFKGEDFFYRAIGTQPNALNEFTVKLPSNATAYKAVVLANARSMLSTIPVAREQTPGTTRTSILESITQQLTLPVTGWTNSLATNGIPMWGYENDLVVNEGSSNPAATISLTRMVAKIDITVDDDVTNFKLASVRLYNYSNTGSIAPAASTSGISGYDVAQWNGVKAIAPHLPDGAKVGAGVHIDYSISAHPGSVSFTNEIYAYEAQAGIANTVTNTCLVIGGYHEGSTTPTYYRVEFIETGGSTFLGLLRNHKYSVTITEVSSHGYPSANDAYVNKPANIVVQITPWNEGGLDDITFDPQHYLAVDKSEIVFYASGDAKTMLVKTDFPTGWTLEHRPDWLTPATPTSGGANAQSTLTFSAAPLIAGDLAREDFFYIVAGNLRKTITVKQLFEEEFMIQITDLITGNPVNELSFAPGNLADLIYPDARSILVTWLPADAPCTVEITPVGALDPFVFLAGDPTVGSPYTASPRAFTIQPAILASNQPGRASRLDFSMARDGHYRMAVLYLDQENEYVTPEPDAAGYLADDETLHSFTVRSNRPWVAVIETGDDPDNLLDSWTRSGGPNPAGESFEFILDGRVTDATAIVTFKSPDETITYGTATIKGEAAFHFAMDDLQYISDNIDEAHSETFPITTDIPVELISVTITQFYGESLLIEASIVDGPALKIDLEKPPLTLYINGYNVTLTYNAQVVTTFPVGIYGYQFSEIGGKLVSPQVDTPLFPQPLISTRAFLEELSHCPPGTSQPRSAEEAMWYLNNVGTMHLSHMAAFNADGVQDGLYGNQAVIWYGATVVNATVDGDPYVGVVPSIWGNYSGDVETLSTGNTLTSTRDINDNLTSHNYIYPHGQMVREADGTYLTVLFRCVAWD